MLFVNSFGQLAFYIKVLSDDLSSKKFKANSSADILESHLHYVNKPSKRVLEVRISLEIGCRCEGHSNSSFSARRFAN